MCIYELREQVFRTDEFLYDSLTIGARRCQGVYVFTLINVLGETSIGFGLSLMNFFVALQSRCICLTWYRIFGENRKLRAVQGLSSHLSIWWFRQSRKKRLWIFCGIPILFCTLVGYSIHCS